MELKHADLIAKLTLEEKCSLLSGMDFWQTQDIPSINLPNAFLSDGPSGLRKQAEEADHLGLNPSIPAVCMPSAATIANTWNPELAYIAGKTIGEEALQADVSMLLGPGVNIKRNMRELAVAQAGGRITASPLASSTSPATTRKSAV